MTLPLAARILSFGAHPDDIEIGCGGTEAALAAQGAAITHVFVTSGEAGSNRIPSVELAAIREREALAAARILGVHVVEFLRYSDGLTQITREMRIATITLIRKIRPDLIFVHAATDLFPDHRIVHDLVTDAAVGAAGPWYGEAAGDPWQVPYVLGYEVWHPLPAYQLAVDISDHIRRKIEALACHHSQTDGVSYVDAFRGLARYRGAMTLAAGYAEVFEVIRAGALLSPVEKAAVTP